MSAVESYLIKLRINYVAKMIHEYLENPNKINKSKILIILFIAFILLRLIGITNDLGDFHHFRQTYTALFSKNFYENGMNLFKPDLGILNYKNVSEFHAYTYLVAIFYKIFGYHIILGRLVSVLFSIGTFIIFYKLIRDFFDEYTAIISSYFLTILPLSIFYSRVFMLESMMLFLSVGMVYFSVRYLETESIKHFIIFTFFSALTILIKIPTLYMGIPIFFMFIMKYQWSVFRKFNFYFYGLLTLFPSVFWYFLFPKYFSTENMADNSLISVYYSKDAWEFYLQLFKNPSTYKGIFLISIAEYHLGLVVFIFAIGGIVLLFLNLYKKTTTVTLYSNKIWVFFYWVLGFCFFIFMFIAPNLAHEYYQLPIQLPAIALAAYFVRVIFPVTGKIQRALIIISLLGLIPFSFVKLKGRLEIDPFYENFAKNVRTIVPETEMIVAMDNMPRSEVFYFSERKGYQLILPGALSFLMIQVTDEIKNNVIGELTTYIQQGATYFVIPYYEFPTHLPWMKEYMDKNYTCMLGCDVTVEQSIKKDPNIPGFIYKLK